MDDAGFVRVLQGVTERDEVLDRLLFAQGSATSQPLRERLTFDQLHGQPPTVCALAHVEGRDDVRVIEHRHKPRLPLQTLDRALLPGRERVQDLQRDSAIDRELSRTIDPPGPAA